MAQNQLESYMKELKSLPFFEKFDSDEINNFFNLGSIIKKDSGSILTKQFGQSNSFFILIDGQVEFSISLDGNFEELSVGKTDKKFTPIGWSGFRSPKRYATTVSCVKECNLVEWDHQELENFFKQKPKFAYKFFYVCYFQLLQSF